MRVLHVVPGLAARTGGVATGVVQLCLALESAGIETTIVATDKAGSAVAKTKRPVRRDELPEGAERLDVRLFPTNRPLRLLNSRGLRLELARIAASYDLIHIHSLWLLPQLAGYRAAARADRPWIVSLEGTLDPWLRRRSRIPKALISAIWQRRMLTQASLLHMTTDEEARLAHDIAPWVPRAIVPYPVDCGAYLHLPDQRHFRDRFLDGHDGPVVMHFGRIAEKKGIDLLIRAFANVHRALPDSRLAVVGPDDDGLMPRLKALAKDLAVEDATTFVGMVSGRDRLAALAAADVWVLASHTENFGLAVVEALAAGRPVIVSRAVNCAPDLLAADAARVVSLDPNAIASEIVGLLMNDRHRSLLGERGRSFARRYASETVAQQAAAMYRDAMRLHRHSGSQSLSVQPEIG